MSQILNGNFCRLAVGPNGTPVAATVDGNRIVLSPLSESQEATLIQALARNPTRLRRRPPSNAAKKVRIP